MEREFLHKVDNFDISQKRVGKKHSLNEERKRRRTWEFCCETIRLEGIREKKGLDLSWRRDIERHHIDPS